VTQKARNPSKEQFSGVTNEPDSSVSLTIGRDNDATIEGEATVTELPDLGNSNRLGLLINFDKERMMAIWDDSGEREEFSPAHRIIRLNRQAVNEQGDKNELTSALHEIQPQQNSAQTGKRKQSNADFSGLDNPAINDRRIDQIEESLSQLRQDLAEVRQEADVLSQEAKEANEGSKQATEVYREDIDQLGTAVNKLQRQYERTEAKARNTRRTDLAYIVLGLIGIGIVTSTWSLPSEVISPGFRVFAILSLSAVAVGLIAMGATGVYKSDNHKLG
jgi:hypothetical protein